MNTVISQPMIAREQITAKTLPHLPRDHEPFNQAELDTLVTATRASVLQQVKSDIDRFAKLDLVPRIELMKAAKNAGENSWARKVLRQRAAMASRSSSAPAGMSFSTGHTPYPPDPRAHLFPLSNFVFYSSLSPNQTYWLPWPQNEINAPIDSDAPESAFGSFAKVELAQSDGEMSVGAAIGETFGVKNGPDKWLLGDASIAQASLTNFLTIPIFNAPRSAEVFAHFTVPNNPILPTVLVESDPGWVGLLGYVTVTLSEGTPVSGNHNRFLLSQGTVDGGGPDFSLTDLDVQATFTMPAAPFRNLAIVVTTTLAVLRLSGVDGYELNAGSMQFRGSGVTASISPGAWASGPVTLTDLSLVIL